MQVVEKFAEPTISPEQLRKQQQQKLQTNKKQILWEDSFRKWTHKIAKKDLTTESHEAERAPGTPGQQKSWAGRCVAARSLDLSSPGWMFYPAANHHNAGQQQDIRN